MAVVVIMSHGRHGLVAACDGREIETEWILRQLNNDGCPNLKGKPKLFIFQACRSGQSKGNVCKHSGMFDNFQLSGETRRTMEWWRA